MTPQNSPKSERGPKHGPPAREWWVIAERDTARVMKSTSKPSPAPREDGTASKVLGPYESEARANRAADEAYSRTVTAFIDRLRAGKAKVA